MLITHKGIRRRTIYALLLKKSIPLRILLCLPAAAAASEGITCSASLGRRHIRFYSAPLTKRRPADLTQHYSSISFVRRISQPMKGEESDFVLQPPLVSTAGGLDTKVNNGTTMKGDSSFPLLCRFCCCCCCYRCCSAAATDAVRFRTAKSYCRRLYNDVQ